VAPDLLMPIEPDVVLGLPVDKLALLLLEKFADESLTLHRHNFFNSANHTYASADVANPGRIVRALAEAFDWLTQHGLISWNLDGDFITRKGHEVLEADDGLALVQAGARIDVDLHRRIADRVRSQFLLGEYEPAAWLAMREVEIRVRELASASAGDIGVPLMTKAFREGGALRDPSAEGGEQTAMMNLFQGAIGVFKNPTSHRQVDYANPTIASEVLFADLLLRMLDERAATLSK
jgi:uncharacterized protein (TIGR02391 family)